MKLSFADFAACALQLRGNVLPTYNLSIRVNVARIKRTVVPGADLLPETIPAANWVSLARDADGSFRLA